jgi:hypothetical protein
MFVDDAARRGFEGRRERRGRFANVVIYQWLQLQRFVPGEKSRHEKEQLRLSLVEVAHELCEQTHIALLLPDGRRRGMLAGARQVRAIAGALNLRKALGPAANGANLLTERRTSAPRAPCAAERTNHVRIIV